MFLCILKNELKPYEKAICEIPVKTVWLESSY
jgi:hypothetical protein